MYEPFEPEDDDKPTLPMWGTIDRTPTVAKGKRDTYVPAVREPVRVRRIEVLPPEPAELQAPGTVQTQIDLHTSHYDRAKGFSLATLPLAGAVGVGAALIAVLFFELEVFSLAAVTVLFVAFMLTWLVAWVVYQLASPDGVSLFSAWGHYQLLRHEQRARLRRMERDE